MVERPSEHLDGIFHALADPTRRAVLERLSESEASISELAEPFPMSFAAVSKHVKVLEEAGLVKRTVSGRTHHCRLASESLMTIREWLRYYERFWDERLDALEFQLGRSRD